MVELKVREYCKEYELKWDDFVMNRSINGTFQQTRNFLNYHGDRFTDNSLIVYKGNDTIVAVIPACDIEDNGIHVFNAHAGSTFGGIVMGEGFYDVDHVGAVIALVEEYVRNKGFNKLVLKLTSDIFARKNANLLYYFLFQKGYTPYDEISCYIDFNDYKEDIISNFTAGRRRDYKYSLRNDLTFRKLETRQEVESFYAILCDNLNKFDTKPVHSLGEIIDFKENRLKSIAEFYGVYNGDTMIAGSMVFIFKDQVFHTQYLAADQSCLKLYPMNYLDVKLIETSKERGFRYFSFGTSTFEHGKVLNKPLIEFKSGFGTEFGLNRTFVKNLSR
jgi:hypothetical protein